MGWILADYRASFQSRRVRRPPKGKAPRSIGLKGASEASVDDKLARYLLNPDHPFGGFKAKWFDEALGFTRSNAGDPAQQIRFGPSKAEQMEMTQFGAKFKQATPITGANGRTIDVSFVWIPGPNSFDAKVPGRDPADFEMPAVTDIKEFRE